MCDLTDLDISVSVVRITSEKLLLVVEAVSLDGGELQLVLLDDLLQIAVQILLLLLKKLLFLSRERHTSYETRNTLSPHTRKI